MLYAYLFSSLVHMKFFNQALPYLKLQEKEFKLPGLVVFGFILCLIWVFVSGFLTRYAVNGCGLLPHINLVQALIFDGLITSYVGGTVFTREDKQVKKCE